MTMEGLNGVGKRWTKKITDFMEWTICQTYGVHEKKAKIPHKFKTIKTPPCMNL